MRRAPISFYHLEYDSVRNHQNAVTYSVSFDPFRWDVSARIYQHYCTASLHHDRHPLCRFRRHGEAAPYRRDVGSILSASLVPLSLMLAMTLRSMKIHPCPHCNGLSVRKRCIRFYVCTRVTMRGSLMHSCSSFTLHARLALAVCRACRPSDAWPASESSNTSHVVLSPERMQIATSISGLRACPPSTIHHDRNESIERFGCHNSIKHQ